MILTLSQIEQQMAKRAKNPLSDDPTRTVTLRKRAVSEINSRFGKIKQLITKSLVDNKIFAENVNPLQSSDFVFLRSPEKLEHFDVWLKQAINEIVLAGDVNVNSSQLHWMLEYFKGSYVRGIKSANNIFASIYGRNAIPEIINPLNVPFHVERLQFLFTRDFAQLKGITETMSQQISYELSQGLLQGKGIKHIAREINKRVDGIGIARSRLLARTEIVNTLNLGRLNETEMLSNQLGEDIVFLWISGSDARVRQTHRQRGTYPNNYFSPDKVAQLIGEPNCRCAITPVPISRVPEDIEVIK